MAQRRFIIIAAAVTMLVTFYTVNELHRLSAMNAEADDSRKEFVTSEDTRKASVVVTKVATSSPPPASPAPPSPPPPIPPSPPPAPLECFSYEHTELWGEVVGWGTQIKASTKEECCNLCKSYKPAKADDLECNVWVWCGDVNKCGDHLHQCWLKHMAHPGATKPVRQGENVFWTSGTVGVDINADPRKDKHTQVDSKGDRKFHIVTSAQGSAVHWQIRVHYYWYLKMKKQCETEGPCDMGGFTRLLHSGKSDDLMQEIPTMVVDPLPQSMVEHSWYIVLNRPYAFVQWVKTATIPERYVLMSEPDHVFLRPLPNFMTGEAPAAFPFFYIEPGRKEHVHITQRFAGPLSPKQIESIAPIGNSPTYMSFADMKNVMPIWMNVSIAVFKDQEANRVWGWVQEMYGFTIACYLSGIKHVDLFLHMMSQPPWDHELGLGPDKPFYILHYTYGMDYKFTGEFTPGKYGEWRWDKRTYGNRPPPRHLGDPPAGMKNKLVKRLIDSINEASAAIPCWDSYAETGKVESCSELTTMAASTP